ncbi:MAG: Ig-like domain-containing protein [Candidatus Azobacteroides sp.]|nr:Ig-like domain-containing protein [Candidatus Azobacteroides sp.]
MQFFKGIKKAAFVSIYLLLLMAGWYACASIGSPSGGDYDVEAPRFVGSDPPADAVRSHKNKITLDFNEYLSLEKPSEKVIITPPQKKMPSIRAIGKKIVVELKDSLIPNTTYTFDFTNAIVDNNERNSIEGFTFAFSTGDVIDSLAISGLLLTADNLEPSPNMMVGIHSDLSDTAFTTLPFLRTSQTNELGRFWIRNVAPGTYHIFALNDKNRNFQFDQGEEIAFCDSLIAPSFEPAIRMDTVWKDSLTIDTIKEIHYTRFTPDDVLLRLFKEDFDLQYLSKSERVSNQQFTLSFNSTAGLPPSVALPGDEERTDWYIREQSPDKKTLTYWITDSLLYQQDTLMVQVNYLAHDTLNNLTAFTDTIKMIQRKKDAPPAKKGKDKEKTEDENKIAFLEISTTASGGSFHVDDTLRFTFSEPVVPFDAQLINIQQKVDTLWEERHYPLEQDSLNPRVFYMSHRWPYNQDYRIRIDSGTIFSIYNKWNDSLVVNIHTMAEEEYGHLYVTLNGAKTQGVGQLLDGSEKVVMQSTLNNMLLKFENVRPGKYYLRYFEDVNGNGKWDTGNYAENRQPEEVFYYPGFFELKKNMDMEQSWNMMELPIEKQKPLDITKNKPKEKQPKRNDRKNENQKSTNSRAPSGRGIPGMPRL